jgi:hypothetical protein
MKSTFASSGVRPAVNLVNSMHKCTLIQCKPFWTNRCSLQPCESVPSSNPIYLDSSATTKQCMYSMARNQSVHALYDNKGWGHGSKQTWPVLLATVANKHCGFAADPETADNRCQLVAMLAWPPKLLLLLNLPARLLPLLVAAAASQPPTDHSCTVCMLHVIQVS